jgi:hypothetical protein
VHACQLTTAYGIEDRRVTTAEIPYCVEITPWVPILGHLRYEPFRASEDGTRAVISILISQAGHGRCKMVAKSLTGPHRLRKDNMEAPDPVVGLVVSFSSSPVSDTPSVCSGHPGFTHN